MHEDLYAIYKDQGVNVDNCVEIKLKENLELRVNGKYPTLERFLKDNFKPLFTINYSTKPNVLTPHMFIDVKADYFVLSFAEEAIGYGSRVKYYNGYHPFLFFKDDFKDFDLDRLKLFDFFARKRFKEIKYGEAYKISDPLHGEISSCWIDRDFLEENPLYERKTILTIPYRKKITFED